MPVQRVSTQLSDGQPYVVKNDDVIEPVQDVLLERDMIWGVVSRIGNTDFVHRDDMGRFQMRNVHAENAENAATIIGEPVEAMKLQ